MECFANETLKIILSVLCISFLIYLLFALYFSTSDGKQKEQATSFNDDIN
jgi:hypothetical protein